MQPIGLDGSVLGNPLDWGIVKLGTAAANYFGGVAMADGLSGGSGARHGHGAGPGFGTYGNGDGGLGDIEAAS